MKSGSPLPIDTAWVPANRSLPLLQASSFGNDYWQPVYAINQSTSQIFAKDPAQPPSPTAPTPSVGRNQLCPCRSGRKVKKCCSR
jgi:uncharacterized protein YecA (UPF0149 family)